MTPEETFKAENKASIAKMGEDQGFKALTRRWFDESCRHRYSYHFSWMGRPIIQYPQDIIALQEIIWAVKPDLVVVLYVPVIYAQKLVAKKKKRAYLKGKSKDLYEEDIKYLEKVERMYLLMIKKYKNWVKIDCVENGKIISPELIHQKILEILRKKGYL